MKKAILLMLSLISLLSCGGDQNKNSINIGLDKVEPGLEEGMKYALLTKATLGKKLIAAIQAKGVENAVTFCSHNAISLTDSMSLETNAKIKRVSDKPRNPKNKANEKELGYISKFKKQLVNQEGIKPILEQQNETINFYFPIITNAMCLQCHGSLKQELNYSTYEKIKDLYPLDEAIGYKVDQVRGIWSIEFIK